MDFGSRLKQLREQNNISRETLANSLQLSYWALSKYENNNRFPDKETLQKIADYFKVSIDSLIRNSTPQKNNGNFNKPNIIPILSFIRAELPILAEENWEDEIEVPAGLEADFALRVKGDSMSWVGIHNGDLALMRQANTASHGMIVAVIAEDKERETTLNFYIQKNGHPVLRAANPAFRDTDITEKHRIIGQLIKVIKEPPSLATYKDLLGTKKMADEGWTDAIETAVQIGFNGKELKKAVEVLGLLKEK
ncbi:MAG: S24 family peptidase [Dehalobacterium sp.]